MALSNLFGWSGKNAAAPTPTPDKQPVACGAACGAGDKPADEKKPPVACGTACGAGDKPADEKKPPVACGTACGAGDK